MPPTYTDQSKSSVTLNPVESVGSAWPYDDNQYTYDDIRLMYDGVGQTITLTGVNKNSASFSNQSKS